METQDNKSKILRRNSTLLSEAFLTTPSMDPFKLMRRTFKKALRNSIITPSKPVNGRGAHTKIMGLNT